MNFSSRAVEQIAALFPDAWIGSGESAGQPYARVRRERIRDILAYLKGDESLRFDVLVDLCGVDLQGWQPPEPERFAVVYQLLSTSNNAYARIKAYVPEGECVIDSVHDLWASAPWAEREAYDMFGIEFRGHPDLKRILLPEYYTGHPLRKDYPLRGMGERETFPRYTAENRRP